MDTENLTCETFTICPDEEFAPRVRADQYGWFVARVCPCGLAIAESDGEPALAPLLGPQYDAEARRALSLVVPRGYVPPQVDVLALHAEAMAAAVERPLFRVCDRDERPVAEVCERARAYEVAAAAEEARVLTRWERAAHHIADTGWFTLEDSAYMHGVADYLGQVLEHLYTWADIWAEAAGVLARRERAERVPAGRVA